MTVADDLADPRAVDEDELAPEDQLPEAEGGVQGEDLQPRSDGSSRRPAPILAVMRSLGPCTAREIADRLGREIGNVSTQLRGYEGRGEVHRTGRSVNEGGRRGGPQIEWALGASPSTNGTGPSDALADPPAPLEVERERVRRLTGQVEHLSREVEAREDERDRARADLHEVRDELRARGQRLGELEQEIARLQAIARRVAEQPQSPAAAAAPDMRERYFGLLMEMAGRDGVDEHVFDRIERLIAGPAVADD